MSSDTVMRELKGYDSPKSKLTRLIQEGKIHHICHGVYATEEDEPRLPIASMIMEQSYLSFQTALFFHGLIPVDAAETLSSGYLLKRNRIVSTPYGYYSFLYIPPKAYPFALTTGEEGGYRFPIATPEKALCDLIYRHEPFSTLVELETFFEQEVRINRSTLINLDWNVIKALSSAYRCRNFLDLRTWREQNVR